MGTSIKINRAPVLTLWSVVVAGRLGFDRNEALTLGRAVAGLNAYSKGVHLGIYEPTPAAEKDRKKKVKRRPKTRVFLLRRAIPVVKTAAGVRALSGGKPISPVSVERYLRAKFGDHLGDVRRAMGRLARSMPPRVLAKRAYSLYERFRPGIPAGVRGWGASGKLDLDRIIRLAK